MANLYVSSLGNDTTGDGSFNSPYLTIKKAHDEASSGDHVWLADADGEFSEDWGSGYPQWTADGVYLSSLFDDAKCSVTGVSGTFGFRLGGGLSDVKFSNVIFTTSGSAVTAIFGISTSTATTGVQCTACRFKLSHRPSSTNGYLVTAGGSGAHTGWKFEGCEFDGSNAVYNGINAKDSDWEITDCEINLKSGGSTRYAIRQLAGNTSLLVRSTKVTGDYGLLQTEGTADGMTRIVDCEFNCKTAAVTISGTTTGIHNLQMDGCSVDCVGSGVMIAGDNVDFSVSNSTSTAGNPSWGLPTDGAYTNVTGSAHNITANCKLSATNHAILLGAGADGVFLSHCKSIADLGGYSIVIKGSNHVIQDCQFTGGGYECVYFKGVSNSKFTDNTITYQNNTNTGAAIGFAQQDSTVPSGNRIEDNTVSVTGANLFGIESADDDGTNVVDFNVYNVIGGGAWGKVDGTTCSSLTDVRAAWTLTTNDDNSGEYRLPAAGGGGDATAANQTSILSAISGVQTDTTAIISTGSTGPWTTGSGGGGGGSSNDPYSYSNTVTNSGVAVDGATVYMTPAGQLTPALAVDTTDALGSFILYANTEGPFDVHVFKAGNFIPQKYTNITFPAV